MEKKNIFKILPFVLVLMLLLFLALGTLFTTKNYVAKTDIQYMLEDWDVSWHTLTTDSTFSQNKVFYLNVDIAVSADVVKQTEVAASVSFISPLISSSPSGIEVVDGPQGSWSRDNVGTYFYSFKVPVSKAAKDKEGRPAYTNVLHLKFKILPDVVGTQEINIKFENPLSAYNRNFVFSVHPDGDGSVISAQLPNEVSTLLYDERNIVITSPKGDALLVGSDNTSMNYIQLIPKSTSFPDYIEKKQASLEYVIKKTDPTQGKIISILKGSFETYDYDFNHIVVKESDYKKGQFNNKLAEFLGYLRQGTRIDFTVKVDGGFRKKRTSETVSFDYNSNDVKEAVLFLNTLSTFRDVQILPL